MIIFPKNHHKFIFKTLAALPLFADFFLKSPNKFWRAFVKSA